MERKHDLTQPGDAETEGAGREQDAHERLIALSADDPEPRPWRARPGPPTALDLTQYALRRSGDLDSADLLAALTLLPAARADLDAAEVGLLFAARSEGLTWAQIAAAMGFRSPQACQQHVSRLSARRDGRP